MSRRELAALQSSIREQGYEWEAAPTSLSDLSPDEQAARLGLVVDEVELHDLEQAIMASERLRTFAAVDAPTAVDLKVTLSY